MALSNIFREPRRELVESVVGTLFVFGLLAADFFFAKWLVESVFHAGPANYVIGRVILTVLVPIIFPLACVVIWAVFFLFPHSIGEQICEYFQDRGIQLRPRTRLKRDHLGNVVIKEAW